MATRKVMFHSKLEKVSRGKSALFWLPGRLCFTVKSYYYWIAKIRKLALEELPRKSHGCRPVMEQTALIPDAAPEFTEVSLHGRQDPCAAPAAVLRAGTVTVDLFEDTPRELLETILKAVRSC